MNSTESAKHPQKRMAPRFKGSDATGEGREVEDEQRVFKKTEQVIGRPPVTDNINDQYMRDPPNNQPWEPNTDRKTRGLKEGAWEEEEEGEKVLGDEPGGRTKPLAVMSEVTHESTVHPNSAGDLEPGRA